MQQSPGFKSYVGNPNELGPTKLSFQLHLKEEQDLSDHLPNIDQEVGHIDQQPIIPIAIKYQKPQAEMQLHRCKCSKIGCLKMYCQCFAKGSLCGKKCTCMGCQNCRGNQKRILLAQQMANFRKSGSFFGIPEYVPLKKCTCKKSYCQKKYCECFAAGIACGPHCQCLECSNKNIFEKEEKILEKKIGVKLELI